METTRAFEKYLKEIINKAKAQHTVTTELVDIFDNSSQSLLRCDYIQYLRSLKAGIMKEVEYIERMERAGQSGHCKGSIVDGLAGFGLGSLAAALMGIRNPVRIGTRLANSALTKDYPFGTVLIAIGKEGIPKGLKVISIPAMARESSVSDSEVKANLRNSGYILMTLDEFAAALEKVERGIMDGNVSFPIRNDHLIGRIV